MTTSTTILALSPAASEFALPSLQTAFSSPSSILYPPSPPTSSPGSSLGSYFITNVHAGSHGVTFGDGREGGFSYSHSAAGGATRDERPPHEGPGSAVYVRQPTRSQLKAASVGLFGSPYKPFYYKDPWCKHFIDVDGHDCGPRWVLVNPSRGKKRGPAGDDAGDKGCAVM